MNYENILNAYKNKKNIMKQLSNNEQATILRLASQMLAENKGGTECGLCDYIVRAYREIHNDNATSVSSVLNLFPLFTINNAKQKRFGGKEREDKLWWDLKEYLPRKEFLEWMIGELS